MLQPYYAPSQLPWTKEWTRKLVWFSRTILIKPPRYACGMPNSFPSDMEKKGTDAKDKKVFPFVSLHIGDGVHVCEGKSSGNGDRGIGYGDENAFY